MSRGAPTSKREGRPARETLMLFGPEARRTVSPVRWCGPVLNPPQIAHPEALFGANSSYCRVWDVSLCAAGVRINSTDSG